MPQIETNRTLWNKLQHKVINSLETLKDVRDLDLNLMTLVLKPDLDIMIIYFLHAIWCTWPWIHPKNTSYQKHIIRFKSYSLDIDTQTHRQACVKPLPSHSFVRLWLYFVPDVSPEDLWSTWCVLSLEGFGFIFDRFVMATRQNSQTQVFSTDGGELELSKDVMLKISCGTFTEETLVSCKLDFVIILWMEIL